MTDAAPPGGDLSSVIFGPRRRPSVWWQVLWQMTPPLLMLLPWSSDGGAGFMFFIGLLFWVAILLVASLVRDLLLRRWWRMVGPALALLVFIANVQYLNWSMRQAREHVTAMAHSIQARCEADRHCPEQALTGEPWVHNLYIVSVPRTHLTWPMEYRQTDDGFVLTLRLFTDMHVSWAGGPGTPARRLSAP